MNPASDLYLDLLKRTLTNWINGAAEMVDLPPERHLRPELLDACRREGVRVVRPSPSTPPPAPRAATGPPPPRQWPACAGWTTSRPASRASCATVCRAI